MLPRANNKMWYSSRVYFRPLFFILYINDLLNASKLTETLIFADDTSIFYSHSDPKYLESVMNEELNSFDIWMKCNKLSVNVKKANYIIFKSSRKKSLKKYPFTSVMKR